MAVAAVSDVETRMRRELADDEQDDARDLITAYQAELEGLLACGVERRVFVEEHQWPPPENRIEVRRGPIATLSSLVVGGILTSPTFYRTKRWHVDAYGWVTSLSTLVVVTYEGGWPADEATPAKWAVVARVARMMARHDDDDEGTKSSQVEGHAVIWADDAFTDAELRSCAGLRGPGAIL